MCAADRNSAVHSGTDHIVRLRRLYDRRSFAKALGCLFSDGNPLHYMLAMFISLVVCYIGGSIWFCFVGHVDLMKSLSLTVLPFVPFDLVKIVFCGFLAQALIKALSKQKQLFA